MRAKSFADMKCSVAGALEAVVDRWGILILRDLILGLRRYDELQHSTGIAAQTLATRLKQLEEAGLVARHQYQTRPPRHEYVLTDKGRDLWGVITALREWGDRWNVHGADGPPLDLVHRDSGHPLQLALTDTVTGAVVDPADAVPRAGSGADDLMTFRLR